MNSATCTLFNLQRFSTEDGPGIRTTLFFKGCPLRCPWCHNPEGLRPGPEVMWQSLTCLGCGDCADACPQTAIHLDDSRVHVDRRRCRSCGRCVQACPSGARELAGTEYTMDALLNEVLKDRAFYATSGGGVTFSGGEPLAQHGFLLEFAPRCRAEGLHLALDTCGLAKGDYFESVLEWVDLVLFDIKLMDADLHRQRTGGALDGILSNLDRVVASGLPLWVRTPIIPGQTDDEENLRSIASYLKANVPTLQRYDLLAFSNLCTSKYEMLDRSYPFAETSLLTRRTMERLTRVVRSEGIEVAQWSGPTRMESKVRAP